MNPSGSQQAPGKPSTVVPPAPVIATPADAASMDPAHRHAMVAEAAFYISQAHGFTPDQELADWLAAEREIEHRLLDLDHRPIRGV